MATIEDKIAGLYIAFFDRAPDKTGLNQWKVEALRVGEEDAIKSLASGFATHTKFTDLYQGLSNQEFVEAIYKNTLGQAGDSEGIKNWTNLLDSGVSKSDMVADFISISLDFDPNSPQYANLSEAEIQSALQRQALITNKVSVSLKYVDILSDSTNISPNTDASNPSSLDSDPAYQASIKVLSTITDDKSTVDTVLGGLNLLKDKTDAVSIINSLSTINQDSVSDAINSTTPTPHNSLSHINSGLGDLSTSNSEGVSALNSGSHWNTKEVTYSFNQSIPDSYYENDLTNNWKPLNTEQQNTVISITQEISNLLDINLTKVDDGGDIRFNIISMEDSAAGFSFYPATNPDYGGDVFLSQAFNTDPTNYGLSSGEGGWMTITHELGHALGLKHPFEGEVKLPSSQDNFNHTVMSYTPSEDIVPHFIVSGNTIRMEYNTLYPELYSLYDVSTLQSIYGVNRSYHTEDNIYTTEYNDYKIETIWDAGGKDTIDLSSTKGSTTIDLHGGTLNSVDVYSLNDIIALHQEGISDGQFRDWIKDRVTELYNDNKLYTGKDNFGIANGVIIENIKTGSGDDKVTDNSVDNVIYTGGGDDKIYIGSGGYDYIDGGVGEDSIYLNLTQNQITITESNSGVYSLTTDSFGTDFINIEDIYLNGVKYTPQELIA